MTRHATAPWSESGFGCALDEAPLLTTLLLDRAIHPSVDALVAPTMTALASLDVP